MMVSNVNARQTKRSYTSGTRLVVTVILTVLWVVLSLFASSCTDVEAAVPKPEEISGEYQYYAKDTNGSGSSDGTRRLIFKGNQSFS